MPQRPLEPINFDCIHCDQNISAEPSDAGLSFNCPSCGGGIKVPGEPVTSNLAQAGESASVEAPAKHSVVDNFKAGLISAKEKLPDKEARDRILTQAKVGAKKAKAHIDQSGIAHKVADLSKGGWARFGESAHSKVQGFSLRSAVPLFVCALGFGWVITLLLPARFFPPELSFSSLFGVVLLAIPSVAIAFLGMKHFLGNPRMEWIKFIGALLFTMFAGIAILLFFFRIAEASQSIEARNYGRATPFILGTKLIGWLASHHSDGNILLRLLASIFHTGFCEEVTKLLPLFLIVVLNKGKPNPPDLRSFLMIAFFWLSFRSAGVIPV